MCRVFGVSRSGYYAWLKRPESRRKIQNRELLKNIRKVYKVSRGIYGSPRITKALKKEDLALLRDKKLDSVEYDFIKWEDDRLVGEIYVPKVITARVLFMGFCFNIT